VRPTGIFKTTNEYVRALPDYADVPKAVYAALALSLAVRVSGQADGGESFETARRILVEEWAALYASGIVPQAPKGGARA
jgi:hypothetical protein